MAGKSFPLEPEFTPPVCTENRRINTPLPVPESVPHLLALRDAEPRSMGGQPPVLWHSAQGVHVFDAWGNQWLDFSSGVLVTSSGHGHKAALTRLVKPLWEQLDLNVAAAKNVERGLQEKQRQAAARRAAAQQQRA